MPKKNGRPKKRRNVTPRATAAVTAQRVETVLELMLAGLRTYQIIRYVADKTDWPIGARQVEHYIQKATAQLVEASKARVDVELGRAFKRLHDLYGRAMKIQDFKTALAVQKELSGLLGLNAPTRIDHSGEGLSSMLPDLVKALVTDPEAVNRVHLALKGPSLGNASGNGHNGNGQSV